MVLATNSLTSTHFGLKTKNIYMYGRRNRFVSKIGNKKNTYCGKVISSQKFVINLLIFFAQMACGFAWICKFLKASCSPHC